VGFVKLGDRICAGIEPFEIGGRWGEAEKAAEDLIHVGREPAAVGRAAGGKGLRDAAEGGIRIFVERVADEQVRDDAQYNESKGKKSAEPEGEAGPDRADDKHYSAFIT
jgi:hypothetical protein